jgi:hypothetical protein
MRPPKPSSRVTPTTGSERMWTMDVLLTTLSGLVLYVIVTRLRFDDPRWMFNAWTYAIAVPVLALLVAIVLHLVASRYVQTSFQIGFLFSVSLHLLLLILAVNVVIFSQYFPDALAGVKPERSPIRRTVPEYLFQSPQETAATPDWSEPVEAETTSRVIPEQQRQLPPVEQTQPKLEVPQPLQPQPVPLQRFLMRRPQPSRSQPRPADSPSRRARQQINDQDMAMPSQAPAAPKVPLQSDVEAAIVERQVASIRRRPSAAMRSDRQPTLAPPPTADLAERTQPTTVAQSQASSLSTELPRVGESGLSPHRRQRTRASQLQPAGAAPAPQTVAVARADESADRMLSPVDVPITKRGRTEGAQLIAGDTASSMLQSTSDAATGAELARNSIAARAGAPNVTAGDASRAPGRGQRLSSGVGFAPLGAPSAAAGIASAAASGTDASGMREIADRSGNGEFMTDRPSRRAGGATAPALSEVVAAGPSLEFMLDEGPAGLASQVSPVAGVIPSSDQPDISSLELTHDPRPRREVGGPVTPAGDKIAAVESFSRRVMRTQGGAAPTPAGQVGPATEEAIEKGLAYLAGIQNEDGSWSLQGLGEEVLLHSDSAATGLCLLAFQGAGYTHRQHQYADTVSRGLQFLLQNQRTNGDLFRRENQISNRNVAFYSHGIAALALCEAYGMTQDPELKEPAQLALRYIVDTQHYQRGGWRYTPQISSDTSVSGWMMMSLKSGELSGLEVPQDTYDGIDRWLEIAQSPERPDRYRYNPFAPDTPTQRHGRIPTPTMTAVGMLMRMYSGWRRDRDEMKSAADYLLGFPPQMGTAGSPQRDTYYWYYATQVMFHMGGDHWKRWNQYLNPLLLQSQIRSGPEMGSWDPLKPVPDRWSPHAGRLYVTAMNLLNLEVFYRHLPIYEETAE